MTRPSESVRAVKGVEGPRGLRSVRETGRLRAGWPVDVSRTWQVIGSFLGGVVVERDCIVLCLAEAEG